jgi:predicted  nucleic acid-binding Zn-ribbon protein
LSLKGRVKDLSDLQLVKEKLDKRITELEIETTGLKNEVSQTTIENQRHLKIE